MRTNKYGYGEYDYETPIEILDKIYDAKLNDENYDDGLSIVYLRTILTEEEIEEIDFCDLFFI